LQRAHRHVANQRKDFQHKLWGVDYAFKRKQRGSSHLRIALIIMAMKVAARRYLSEFRDNYLAYLARNDLALRAASAAKRLLK